MADIRLVTESKRFGSVRVIDSATMSADSGNLMVLPDTTGCGESMLPRMCAGLVDDGIRTSGLTISRRLKLKFDGTATPLSGTRDVACSAVG